MRSDRVNVQLMLSFAVLALTCLITACTSSPPLILDTRATSTTATPPLVVTTAANCTPTFDDGVSPTYQPNAPVRASVGHGHVLSGVVRSSHGCTPIANAQLELWPEYLGQGHPNNARATIFTDSAGRYHYECDPPEHIHMRISAPGYRTIGQNSYHPHGQPEGRFDVVLAPESP